MEQYQTVKPTICAISTPPGAGAIAVVRLSGPRAVEIADSVWEGRPLHLAATHTAHLGYIVDPEQPTGSRRLDQTLATVMLAPRTYTGQDTVELSLHGSQWIQRQVLNLLIRQGATLAGPGQFTQQAVAAGNIDLAQAEAIADLIAATSRASHRIALTQMRGEVSDRLNELRNKLIELAALLELELDFSDQDVEFADRRQLMAQAEEALGQVEALADTFDRGAAIKDGIPVAIIGPTNAGKSSLLNAITGQQRAIVSDIHGTTRDTIEDTVEIGDYLYRFIDTAGLRDTTDAIERLGQERSHRAASDAHILLIVLDPDDRQVADALCHDIMPLIDVADPSVIIHIILNKSDITTATQQTHPALHNHLSAIRRPYHLHHLSTTTRDGFPELLATLNTPPSACGGANDSHDVASETSRFADKGSKDVPKAATDISINDTESMMPQSGQEIIITNARHYQELRETAEALRQVIADLRTGLPADLIAQPLRHATHHLGLITGAITPADLLSTVFSRFCIGK